MGYRHKPEERRQPRVNRSEYTQMLANLPRELLIDRIAIPEETRRMETEGFRGLGWYLNQIARVFKDANCVNLYLTRGDYLYHGIGVTTTPNRYHPFISDKEFEITTDSQAQEVLPLIGIDTPGWDRVFLFMSGREMRVYNSIVGDVEYITYPCPREAKGQRILAPVSIRERGIDSMGVLEVIGSDLMFFARNMLPDFVPKNEKQLEALIATTMMLIGTISSGIARIVRDKIDPLTALPYKREAHDRILEAITAYRRGSVDDFVLFIMDTDDFKSKNETYGHLLGDDVLRNIARNISNTFRSNGAFKREGEFKGKRTKKPTIPDFVARRSGDEFMGVIISNTEGARIALERARLTQQASVIETDDGKKITQTCTFGAVSIKQLEKEGIITKGMTSEEIAKMLEIHADESLRSAKHTKKNVVKMWGDS